MAYKFCPTPRTTKREQNSKVSTDADVASVAWDVLCPMVFCSDVFPRKSIRKEEPTDMSNSCWYCRVDCDTRAKFVTRKSSDPIPEEIRRVQEMLGFMPGEPLTKYNFYKMIPIGSRKLKEEVSSGSTSQAKDVSPLQTTSLNGQSTLKRKGEKSDHLPLKKQVCDRQRYTAPKDIPRYRTSEYKGIKPGLELRSLGLASV